MEQTLTSSDDIMIEAFEYLQIMGELALLLLPCFLGKRI